MKLWECTYRVTRNDESTFLWHDFVWSTTKPEGNTIGHYFRHGFNYRITDGKSRLAEETQKVEAGLIAPNQMIKQ